MPASRFGGSTIAGCRWGRLGFVVSSSGIGVNQRAHELLQLLRRDQLWSEILRVCLDHLASCRLGAKLSEPPQGHHALSEVVTLLTVRIDEHDGGRGGAVPRFARASLAWWT